ncbi:MAG: serine/threonine-protein kinase [Planctomycetaceae bacterium]
MNPDHILDAFDAAWAAAEKASGIPPRIQQFRLPQDDPHEAEHFQNLVEIDLEYRWRQRPAEQETASDKSATPSLRDYVPPGADSKACRIFSPAFVADAYRAALQNGQTAAHSDYLPFAFDQDRARQLLGRVDADYEAGGPETGRIDRDRFWLRKINKKGWPSLPDYDVMAVLGRGGKGIVYKARQLSLDRTVAIKTLRANGDATATDLQRLQNEAKILGSLHHPNIVTVYSLVQADDQCFLIMEYVSGSDLSKRSQNAPISIRDAALYMQVVADAIQVAHEHGVLHRDIKPSNILLDDAGVIRVTDFGLSRRLQAAGASDPLTATTEVLGTPGYISPEQARGRSRELDETADVYGMGATLYSLLVGIPPFTGQDVISILQQVCERIPTPPGILQPDIPRDLQTICMKCLEKRPQDRYPTAKAVAEELGRFLRGESIQARPQSVFYRGFRWCQRNVALAALLCSVVVLAIGLIGSSIVRSVENARALERERAANGELHDNQIRLARLEYDANELGNAKRILQLLEPTYDKQYGPPWEWKYLTGLLDDSEFRWPMAFGDAVWIGALAYSPDGRFIAAGNRAPNFDSTQTGSKGRVTIRDVSTGQIIKEFTDVMSIMDLLYMDGGAVLVAVEMDMGIHGRSFGYGPATVRRWSTDTWEELPPIFTNRPVAEVYPAGESLFAVTLAQSPEIKDQDLLLYNLNDIGPPSTIRQWRASEDFAGFEVERADGTFEEFPVQRTGSWARQFLHGNRFEVSVARVARGSGSTGRGGVTVSVYQKPGRKLVRTIDVRFVETMAFDCEERQLAIATNRGEIRVWDTETWMELQPFRGHMNQVRSLAFSPDGKRLASGDWDGTVRIWDLSKAPGSVDTGTPVLNSALESFAWNDEAQLVSLIAGEPLKFFPPGSQAAVRSQELPFPPKRLSPGRLSDLNDDGTLIAVASRDDNTVMDLRDTVSGDVVVRLPAHGVRVSFVKLNPNSVATAAWSSGIFNPPLPEDGEIRLSDLRGNELFFVRAEATRVHRLAVSRDASMIAASCEQFTDAGESHCFVRAWNVGTGNQIDEFPISHWGLGLEFNPANHLLAAIAFETGDLTIRDVTKRITIAHKQNSAPEIQDFCFSPDGQRLAGVSRRQLILWNCKTHRQAFDLPLREFGDDMAYNARVRFSADGNTIMANQADGTIRSWGIAGGKE